VAAAYQAASAAIENQISVVWHHGAASHQQQHRKVISSGGSIAWRRCERRASGMNKIRKGMAHQ